MSITAFTSLMLTSPSPFTSPVIAPALKLRSTAANANKNCFIACLYHLVFILVFSISVVSAEDSDNNVLLDESADSADLSDCPDEMNVEYENSIDNEKQLESSQLNEPNVIVPESEDATGIQSAINQANSGDIIQLKDDTSYFVENNVFTILKQNLTIKGNKTTIHFDGAGQDGAGAVFVLKAKLITIEGITFNNTNGPKNYGEEISG